MSDTFDHEGDAWDSFDVSFDEACPYQLEFMHGGKFSSKNPTPARCWKCGTWAHWMRLGTYAEGYRWRLDHICPAETVTAEEFPRYV